jgi:signal transduction histidine kinase
MDQPAQARERLYRRFVAEEVAAAQRHRLVNRLAGAGALSFHLKRQLPPGEAGAAAAAVLPLIDAELGRASAMLDLHFLSPAAAVAAVPLAASLAGAVRWLRALGCPPGVELSGPEPGAGTAPIDPAELELAAFCLLENACQATQDGAGAGTVHLACGPTDDPETAQVMVEVRDQGPGLDGEALARARQPFFSTRPGQLGMGLNVASRIARRWGGRLELVSAPGDGLTARLILPAGAA